MWSTGKKRRDIEKNKEGPVRCCIQGKSTFVVYREEEEGHPCVLSYRQGMIKRKRIMNDKDKKE